MAELSNKLNIKSSNIKLISYEDFIFNDSSLDCPEPGKFYTQVITLGGKCNLKLMEIFMNIIPI